MRGSFCTHRRAAAALLLGVVICAAGFAWADTPAGKAPAKAPDKPAEKDPGGPWQSLFNGHDLTGWVVQCAPGDRNKNFWKVDHHEIVCDSMGHADHDYVWLTNDRELGDFELRLKVKSWANSPGNSGVQVRSRYDEAAHHMDGPQVDIHPPAGWRCGFIYDETRDVGIWLWPNVGKPGNAKESDAPKGWKWYQENQKPEWNDMYIRCQGTHITTIVNGVTIADYDGKGRLDDATHRAHNVGLSGHIALQLHMHDQLHIAFKDIEYRPIASGQ